MSRTLRSSHHKIHTVHSQSHVIPKTRMIVVPAAVNYDTYTVHVPAHSQEEGHNFLRSVGSGSLGSGANDLWLGHTLPWVRQNYKALENAEKEIAEERARLGMKLPMRLNWNGSLNGL